MLVPVQTSGNKPPLFFVHGLHGVMTLGRTLARVLGPDRPIYAIHASGIDGRRPAIDNVRDMVSAYAKEIHGARPMGPILIGGMCSGTLAAIEVARELQQRGRQVGPVFLADPPPLSPGYNKQSFARNPVEPQVARQLYQAVHNALLKQASRPYNDMPFDAKDADELHVAALAGVGSLLALNRHIPIPFPGPVALILSDQGVAAGFFHPQMPWDELLPGPRVMHVLPWDHEELFQLGREQVARALNFMLEETPVFEAIAESQMEPSLA
jgi:thioesterase domain-containing protein